MKKFILTFLLCFMFTASSPSFAQDNPDIKNIGFHKRTEVTPDFQIKKIFDDYQKYSNNQKLDKFLNLHDDSYRSADGYGKDRLKELAEESWKEYPNVKYSISILSIDANLDNATVITKEKLSGITNASVEYIKGNGFIDSESTAIYYLKRFSNEWRITSDFIINEKTSMRYGIARFIPMSLEAPAMVAPNEEYISVLKVNMPKPYMGLISINNEPITFPISKSTEVFRGIKSDGMQERILRSNNSDNNENAIASVGIVKTGSTGEELKVNIVGIAFLSSRVNVVARKNEGEKK